MVAKTAQRSTENVKTNVNRLTRAQNSLWKGARVAPQFCREVKNANGKKSKKYLRLIKPIAYKVALAAACSAVVGETELDMKHLGMDALPESKTRPWMCSLSPGAAMMLEHFLSSIVQQILSYNQILTKTVKRHSKNHADVTALSIEEVKRAIFAPASGVPLCTTVLPLVLSRKKKSSESEAPGDQEVAVSKDDDEAEDAENSASGGGDDDDDEE